MGEVGLVNRREGIAVGAVLLLAKRDGWVAAGAEVERLSGGGGAAGVEA